MSNVDDNEVQSSLTALKVKLNEVITDLAGQQTLTGDRPVDSQILKSVARRLTDLLPMLQFEKMRAENQRDWALVETADTAVVQCQEALDSVNAAILRTVVIGLNSQDIAEMKTLQKQVTSSFKLQHIFGVIIQLAGFVRRLVL